MSEALSVSPNPVDGPVRRGQGFDAVLLTDFVITW
jgi:hypothetical protein